MPKISKHPKRELFFVVVVVIKFLLVYSYNHKIRSRFEFKRKEYTEKQKEIGRAEAKVYRLSELLGVQRSATIENVQRKQALTPGEREQEEEPVLLESDSDDNDDDGTIYNPKNLPLGWDGKVHLNKSK